jgi:ABC-type dipeptide/oligopeptide/nickel transport system permease subunit
MGWSIRGFGAGKALLHVAGGGVVIGLATVVGFMGAALAPYDPLEYNAEQTLKHPGWAHLLGTDPLGRDVFSQIIVGARTSMLVGVCSVGAGLLVGAAIGLVAGTLPGRLSDVLMRVMDALLVFPALILALALVAFLGVGLLNVILVLAATFVPTFAILVRGEVISLREREFIVAARALGMPNGRIMWRHLLPNIADILLVQGSFGVATAILAEASLSFLGLGIPPPEQSWGRMLREGYSYLLLAPWISIAAGSAIFLIVLAFQMGSDGLGDVLAHRGVGAYHFGRRWRGSRQE